MGNIEREIKILDVDVNHIKSILKNNNITAKGKYIQDIYTFDLPKVDELYIKYTNLLKSGDNRQFKKLILEIRPCFDKNDLKLIKNILGTEDFFIYIDNNNYEIDKLLSEDIIKLMRKTNGNFSKWIRLRQTGKQVTITIKKVVKSKGEYALDAVEELEFDVPSIEDGKEFLEDLGYFFARHQMKMRIAYDYKNTEIVIDKWPTIPPYIEIEGPTNKEIEEAILMLGYQLNDSIVINTDDVYKKYGINIYADEYRNLSFDSKEQEEVNLYMQ